MKKTFTILIAAIAAILLITQPMKVVGQSTSVTNFIQNGSSSTVPANSVLTYNTETGQTGIDWTTSAATTNWEARGHAYNKVATNLTATISGATITSVSFVASNNGNNATAKVYVNNTQMGNDQTISGNNGTYTCTNTNGMTGQIKISLPQSSKTIWIKSITVTYTTGPSVIIADQTVTGNAKDDGTFTVSYSSGFTPTTGTIALCDNAAGTTPFSGDWLYDVSFGSSKTTDFSKINYKTKENTTGSTRDVYMKIAVSDGSKGSAEKIVKVTQKRCYTVTFNGHGGETDTKATSYTQYISNGDATNLMANQFTKDNSIFTKWTTNEDGSGTEYEDEEEVTITADLTLYAQWETKHTITYKANSGGGADIVREYAEGTNVTIETNPFTAPDGMAFVKWTINSNGSGDSYYPGDKINNISANYTLYANWANKCTVTLISNGMTTTVDVPQGVSYTFPTPINVPAGYAYRGYSTKSSDVAAGDVKTSFTPNESIATYYAVFSEGGFVKVTAAPTGTNTWDGDYLIVYEDNTCAFNGGLETLDAAKDTINVTISNSKIAYNSKTASAMFTIASNNSYYTIKSASGKYIGRTSSSNGMDVSAETSYLNSISYSNSAAVIQGRYNNSNTYYLRFNNGTNDMRFRYYSSTSQQAIQLYKLTLTGYYTSVSAPVASNITISTPTTITNGAVLNMGTHSLTNTDPANLIIEDGGQLILPDNATVAATVKKNTSASTAKTTNNWYGIASPVADLTIASFVPIAPEEWNVFRYIERYNYWNEYRADADPEHGCSKFTSLENGRGYLYRSTVANVEFAGTVNAAAVNYTLSCANSNDNLKGINLIGNPFTHDIYKNDVYQSSGTVPAINSDKLAVGYYRIQPDGSLPVQYGYNNPIKSGEAVFVKATEGFELTIANNNNPAASYTPTKSGNDNIMFTVANNQYKDVAYAMFNEGIGLNKIHHYNEDVQMLYINHEGENYAIAMMNNDTKVINLGFEAKYIAKYTLSLKANGDFSYLHLIDKLTGEDVDMLLEGEYSFMASPTDNAERFIVRLEYSEGSESSEVFAYQNGSDIIVNGEGTLQVFDVMGRMVMTQRINGVQTVNVCVQGVYILKLNDKVQKIVVR